MSRLQKEAIRRICANEDTIAAALDLLGSASLCTGPGTGYDLREGASGLPAVCAYLASEELGYGEVSANVAQAASCLAPKVWQATLRTVRSALKAANAPPEEEKVGSLDYEDLIKENHIGRIAFVAAGMRNIEKSLLKTGLLPPEFLSAVIVKVSVFAWVCDNVIKVKAVATDKVLKSYDVHQRDYDDIVDILVSSCQDAIQSALQGVEDLRVKRLAASKGPLKAVASATTPAASPSKPAAATVSDRDALLSPQKTPTRKRKVEFAELDDVDYDLLDTPSKRPHTSSPAKSRTATTLAAPAPPPSHTLNPNAISPLKQSRPAGPPPPPRLPALAMPKPSIFPSTKRAAVQSPLELLLNPSSPARTTRAQTRLQAPPAPALAQPEPEPVQEPVAGPSTPRRRGRPPKVGTPAAARIATPARATPSKRVHATPARATPSQKRVPAVLAALRDEDEERRPQRFRPVFLDQRQWFQRDPRAEREWRLVEARMREERAPNVVRSR